MKALTPERITAYVCCELRVDYSELSMGKRFENVIRARRLIVALCRTLTPASFPEIIRATGGRGHSTAVTAWNTANRMLGTDGDKGDPEFREEFERMAMELLSGSQLEPGDNGLRWLLAAVTERMLEAERRVRELDCQRKAVA